MSVLSTDANEVTYSPASPLANPGKLISELVRDTVRYRELIWILFLRDLKAQFRQSMLGYVWLFLPPIMTTAVWLFLNSQKVIAVETTDMPYPLFVMIGSVLWQTFVKLLQCPLQAFHEGKPVFMKLKVPPEAFIAAGTARAVFEFVIYAIVLIPAFIVFQVSPSWSILALPIFLLAIFTLGTAIGLLLIPVGSLYSDIAQATPVIMAFLMYMAPVVYPPPESGLAASVIQWNPMTPLLTGVRDLFTTGSMECVIPAVAIFLVSSLAVFASIVGIRIIMPHLVARMGM